MPHTIQTLERRQLLAATASLVGDQIIITGTPGDDVVNFQYLGSGAKKFKTFRVVFGSIGDARAAHFDFKGRYANRVLSDLGDGNDTFNSNATFVSFGLTFEIHGGPGGDTILGGARNDTLYGDSGIDAIQGGSANDTMYAGGGTFDYMIGDEGDDLLFGGKGIDVLYGAAGRDTLDGGSGNDSLYGDGDPSDVAHRGPDRLYGGDGGDRLYGGPGGDRIYGGRGDDIIYPQDGLNHVDGGPGTDQSSRRKQDELTSIETLIHEILPEFGE